jgi:hypothetical protein
MHQRSSWHDLRWFHSVVPPPVHHPAASCPSTNKLPPLLHAEVATVTRRDRRRRTDGTRMPRPVMRFFVSDNFVVFRFVTVSNVIGRSTGRSLGCAPRAGRSAHGTNQVRPLAVSVEPTVAQRWRRSCLHPCRSEPRPSERSQLRSHSGRAHRCRARSPARP